MRILSLLPSATEIAFALGLGPQVVAVSHECDYPSEVAALPRVTGDNLGTAELPGREIDAVVRQGLHQGASIYHLDERQLQALKPDLILTQELCPVCAVSSTEVLRAVKVLDVGPRVLSLEPHSLDDILATIEEVGRAASVPDRAHALAASLRKRIEAVHKGLGDESSQPRTLCLEWIDPPIVGGHWIPDMVETAGGLDALGTPGAPSRRVAWDEVLASQPDAIILMPCGFDVQRTLLEYRRAELPAGWNDLPAVRAGRVYAVDASAYFARPGPRIADGLELLAHLLHPALFRWKGAQDAVIQASLGLGA